MSELSRICQLGSEIVRCPLLAQHPTPTGSWPCPHQGCLPFPPELLPVPRSSLYFKEEWKTRVICPTWLPAAEIPCGFSAVPTLLLPWVKPKSPLQPTSRPCPHSSLCSSTPGSAWPQHYCSSVTGSRWKLLTNGVESPNTLQGTMPQHCAPGADGVPPPGSPYIQTRTCCAHRPVKETSVLSPAGPGQK